jgi:SAM-dependent methyltransferase
MAELEATHPWTRAMRKLTLGLIRRECRGELARVLDAGCGTGLFLEQWLGGGGARFGAGIDFFAMAFDWARRGTRGVWVVASAADLPFESGSFNAIHSADVLQHLSLEDSARALDSFARLLAPGGILALRVRAPGIFHREPDIDYSHSFSRKRLRTELEERGLKPVFLSHVNSLPSVWAEIARELRSTNTNGAVKGIQADAAGRASPGLLGAYLAVESLWLRTIRLPLPFGHTIICAARKVAGP